MYIWHTNGLITYAPAGEPLYMGDLHTNPTLYSDVYSNPTAYSVIDGVLTREGQPVAINPPCEDCVTLDSVATASTVEELRKVVQLLVDKPGFRRG